jgi:hypothetical protein
VAFHGKRAGVAWFLLIGVLLWALPSAAQLEVGDDWKMSLSGDLGFNYNGNINQGESAHGLGFSGDANLRGSFYNPNFLNFNAQPYYDRTQSNSVFGALTNTSGVNSSVNFFSGSHFPGSISYSKGINATSEFGVPGSSIGLAQHGDFQGFGVSWSELLPNMPTLTASYSIGDGSSSVFGTQEENTQNDHTFSLLSSDQLAGFRLSGGYTHRNVDSNFSEVLDGSPEPVNATTASNNYQFSGQHSFPLAGSFGFAWSRTTYGYDYHDSSSENSSGTSDMLSGNLAFRPVNKLSLSFNANYTDSLLGSIPQPVLNSGTAVNTTSLGTFRSFLVGGDAYYQLFTNLNLHALVNQQHQEFLGKSYEATLYGGSVDYNLNRRFLGSLSFSIGVFDTANQQGNSALGIVGNLNFDRKIHGWDVDANLSYAQNVQTVLLVYTTSSFGWVTNARRRLGNRTFFMAGYSGLHSGITAQAGTSSSANRVSTTFTWHTYSVNGFYSRSDGTAAFTPTGLVPLPGNLPPTVLPPNSVIVYGSKAFGFNVSASPFRRLNISAGYADSKGDTVDPLLSTYTRNDLYNLVTQYKLRKIYLNAGYTRLRQSVGTTGAVPVVVTAYYIGISRWFNFF